MHFLKLALIPTLKGGARAVDGSNTEGAKFLLSWMNEVLYLVLHQASKKWTMPIRNWQSAMAHFEIIYQDRI